MSGTARAGLSVAVAAALIWAFGAAVVLGAIPAAALPLASALAAIAAVALLLRGKLQARTQAALCAAAIALVVSTVSGRSMTVPDSQPASEEPWTVLRHRTVLLDSAPVLRDSPDAHWIYHRADGSRATWYPPGAPLLALPIYLPTALTSAPSTELLSQFEKCAASLMSALTVLLLGLALARAGSPPRFVFAGGLLYGLGTSALSTLSQALWHQTACALALALLLFASIEPERRSSLGCALLSGFIIFTTRPPDVLLLVPFLWAARSRRFTLFLFLGLFLGGLVFLGYNQLVFGSPFALGYKIGQRQLGFTLSELPESTFGIFFGPSHGLLAFLPWLIFLPATFSSRERAVRASLLSVAALVLILSCWWGWWGGGNYGPRMSAEVQLAMVFPIARAAAGWKPATRSLLVALGAVAFLFQAAYIFWLFQDPTYSCLGPWQLTGHPLGHWLLPH